VPFGLEALTGTSDPLAGPTFDIQPNPFRDGTMFRFGLPHGQDVGISITDAGGREVWRREVSGLAGRNQLWWNGVADTGWTLPSGVYFVRLKTEAGMMVRKVVLER
jgi:hypothetical protein